MTYSQIMKYCTGQFNEEYTDVTYNEASTDMYVCMYANTVVPVAGDRLVALMVLL